MSVQAMQSIPFVDLKALHAPLRDRLLEAVGRVIDHGQFILGPEVQQLEEKWAAMCQTEYAVAVSSGTAALTLTLRALGIGEGDEVITAPNSFVASASSIVHAGATPRFVDVADDFNMDPTKIAPAVTPRTKAILAVHLTGRPADMNAINAVAREHELIVLEDAAQAVGARYDGRPVGELASAGCFSLHPLKNVGACGDGGLVTTNDASLARRLRLLRNHGITTHQEDCALWGENARLDTLQAAIVLVKLPYLDEWIARRRQLADIYRQRLDGLVDIPQDRPNDMAVYQTFPVETDHRDALLDHLCEAGIGCAVHYRTPIHLLPVGKSLGYSAGDLPAAERLAHRSLSLPIAPTLDRSDVERVCEEVEAFFHKQT